MQLSQHFETYAALPDHVADAILEEAGIDPAKELQRAMDTVARYEKDWEERNRELVRENEVLRSNCDHLSSENASLAALPLPPDVVAKLAEADRLRRLFDDAGQGEHNVLALIDHYQRNSMEADERSPGHDELRRFREQGRAPAGSCPFCASRISVVERDGVFVARCSHRGCGARGPKHHDLTRACDLFCCPPQRTAGGSVVVLVSGKTGGVHLSHVEVLP